MIERFTTPVVPPIHRRRHIEVGADHQIRGDLVADGDRARLDDHGADAAKTQVLAGVHPAGRIDTEALRELGAAVVGLLGHLDDRRTDAQARPGRRSVDREVEVDDELVAGERPALAVDPGDGLERSGTHDVQLGERIGGAARSPTAATLEVVVADEPHARAQLPDLEYPPFPHRRPGDDQFDDPDVGRRRRDMIEVGIEFLGGEWHQPSIAAIGC